MSTQQLEGTTSLPAAADYRSLTGNGFRLVVKNGAGKAALCGAGARPFGVMDGDKVDIDEQTRIHKIPGRSQLKVEAGGNVAAYAELASDASGKAVTATTGAEIIGYADEAGVSGQVISFSPDLKGPKPA